METKTPEMINLDTVRHKLENKHGREFWRSLDEVAETEEFTAWVEDEFPNRSTIAEIDRRSLLKFMGASLMFAGLGGCRSLFLPSEKIVPYVKMPEDMVPGTRMYFATTTVHNGQPLGIVVSSDMGRPVKVEGNPLSKASGGKTDYFAQAAMIDLYDPDRVAGVTKEGQLSTWDLCLKAMRDSYAETAGRVGGVQFRIVTPTVTSPTLLAQLQRALKPLPNARIVEYESAGRNSEMEGCRIAFGKPGTASYNLSTANVVVSFDGDFLFSMPDSVRMAGDFMSRRHVEGTNVSGMNRLYMVETSPTVTGSMADHRFTTDPATLEALVRKVASNLGVQVLDVPESSTVPAKWVDAIMEELQSGTNVVVVPGQYATPAVNALCHAINEKIGAVSKNLVQFHLQDIDPFEGQRQSLEDFAKDLNAGKVGLLFVLGGNPAYDTPLALGIKDNLNKAIISVHHTLWANETSEECTWVTGDSHFLESWGDQLSASGEYGIVQPLISPIRDTKSQIEFLASILNDPSSGHDLVRATAKTHLPDDNSWKEWLAKGVMQIPVTAATPSVVSDLNVGPSPKASGTTVLFRPDPTVWDGRHANNGWLQELPKVLTTLTWDNAALVSPSMAERLGVRQGEHVQIESGGSTITMPALMMVGHPDDCVTVHMGYGRKVVGNVGTNTGTDVGPIRKSATDFHVFGANVTRAAGSTRLALTQTHNSMEGRDLIKFASVAEFVQNPELKGESDTIAEEGKSLWPENQTEFPSDAPQWGLSIDLNVCIGCHACVTACQAENNIPVVGKDQVMKGREMHWIRIDRYYRVASTHSDPIDADRTNKDVLDSNNIETVFSPVACMHCEKAPCEPVCPVAATVHNHEGLNQMIYNRCVGTRYCSNNCPYKVRRFNYLNYTDNQAQFMERTEILNGVVSHEKTNGRSLLKMLNNSRVTVRGRGVMEKCTYCVHRINQVRIEAKKQNREIQDGEIITACAQACPTGAIVFGNIQDKASQVGKLKRDPRTYSLLPELNTINRTTYMARLRNPNPKLENA